MNRMLLLRARLSSRAELEERSEPGEAEVDAMPKLLRPELKVPVLEAELGRRLMEVLGTLEERLAGLGEDESPGETGTVRVRVMGKESADELLPLPGLTVRWVRKQQRVEARTRGTGMAVLRPPVAEGAYRVRIWAGETMVREARGTLRAGEAPLHRLELTPRAELAPYLEQARRWTQSLANARERVASLRRQAESALPPPPG